MATSFYAILRLPPLKAGTILPFLSYFTLAALGYLLAVTTLKHSKLPLLILWGFALLLRVLLLLTSPPTLSSDVYRYIWDGHLLTHGINPYLHAVNAPLLDAYTTPLRALVNNDWMATPYLPAAQGLFALVTLIAPQNPLAFQLIMVGFDLLTGWLVYDLLKRLGRSPKLALIYLWNPLVILEFAHGAHLDAFMIFLIILTFWLLVRADQQKNPTYTTASVFSLAAATLTKGIPGILALLLVRRWGRRRVFLFGGLLLATTLPFALGAGWGLTGPLDGEGLFGALRIYSAYWNYNSGLYHWLETTISGIHTPGPVPPEQAPNAIFAAKLTIMLIMGMIVSFTTWRTWKSEKSPSLNDKAKTMRLLQSAAVLFAAYLLLTPTIHPWYITIIIPLLPFLFGDTARFRWPAIYYSMAVVFSYLTYIDPDNLREFYLVRQVEYWPLFLILLWAALSYLAQVRKMPQKPN